VATPLIVLIQPGHFEHEGKTMISFKTITAALAFSVVGVTSAFAQFSEPAVYEAMHPDRDVLNGGALTPEAQMRARGIVNATPAFPNAYAGPVPIARHMRRHRR
jgi:hypothetical protein